MTPRLEKIVAWNATLIVAGAVMAALALLAALLLSGNVTRELDTLQQENSKARVRSILQTIDENVQHLGDYTTGYAMWDDSHDFMTDRNPAYLETNYAPVVMALSPTRLVAIFDLSRTMIFSAAIDESGSPATVPAGVSNLLSTIDVSDLRKPGEFLGRVEWLGDQAYLIAICPITDSSGTALISGYFAFGEPINSSLLERLESLTGTVIKIHGTIDPPTMPSTLSTPLLGDTGLRLQAPGNDRAESDATLVFPHTNIGQKSVVIDMQLPVRTYEAGQRIRKTIGVGFILVFIGLALFVAITAMEIRRRRAEIRVRIAEGEQLQLAVRKADELVVKAEAADHAKSAFLAMMSHEIRTPLNAIIGYAALLREEPQDSATGQAVNSIHSSGIVLLRVLNDILDLSKIEAGKLTVHPRPFEIRKLISEVCETFHAQALAKQVRIQSTVAPEVPEWLVTDEIRLKQVLFNLLSNSVKFTSDGQVFVAVGIVNSELSSRLRITVEDEGVGIAKSDEAGLFEPFQQGDSTVARRYDGTGIGLAICKRLCEHLGGDITYERPAHRGCRFAIDLPLQEAGEMESTTTLEFGHRHRGPHRFPQSERPRCRRQSRQRPPACVDSGTVRHICRSG